MLKDIKKIFELVYSNYSGNKVFELELTERNVLYINSFVRQFHSLYNGSIGDSLLLEYTIYQFRYYEDKKTRFGKGKVQLNWIYGSKAIDRWQNKPNKWLYFNDLFKDRYGIHFDENAKESPEKRDFYKKVERKRFLNTEMGMIHCYELDLYDKFSRECLICRFKDGCKPSF